VSWRLLEELLRNAPADEEVTELPFPTAAALPDTQVNLAKFLAAVRRELSALPRSTAVGAYLEMVEAMLHWAANRTMSVAGVLSRARARFEEDMAFIEPEKRGGDGSAEGAAASPLPAAAELLLAVALLRDPAPSPLVDQLRLVVSVAVILSQSYGRTSLRLPNVGAGEVLSREVKRTMLAAYTTLGEALARFEAAELHSVADVDLLNGLREVVVGTMH